MARVVGTAIANTTFTFTAYGMGGEEYTVEIEKGKELPLVKGLFSKVRVEYVKGHTALEYIPDEYLGNFDLID